MFLKNKTAVVTGASTGIGRAVAVAFATQGAFVFITARNQRELQKTQQQINDVGGSCEIILADLADHKSINKLSNSLKRRAEHVDILANIAAIWHGDDEVYADIDFENFDQTVILDTFSVGLTAPTLLTHSLLPLMPPGASILNLSGTFSGNAKGWLPYFVSKRALEDLTIGLADELKDKQIRVNCLSPADTATEAYAKYFPQYLDEAISPDKVAEFALYLCSEETHDINGKVFVLRKDEEPSESFHS